MPSELEIAMESLIKVFHRYASREGRNGTLSRRELRELMENELSNFLRVRSVSPIVVSVTVSYVMVGAPLTLFLSNSRRRTLLLLTKS